MAKARSSYHCKTPGCGNISPVMLGVCRSCGEWDSFEEYAEQPASSVAKGVGQQLVRTGRSNTAPAETKMLSEFEPGDISRISTGIPEFDRVLGGGFVAGSVIMLTGAPGAGKSTLASQIADVLVGDGRNVVYVGGEESGEQMRIRTDRIKVRHADRLRVTSNMEIGAVCALLSDNVDVAIVDSIQTLYDAELPGNAGSTGIVKSCGEALRAVAKAPGGPAILVIGHIIKDGSAAGPSHLKHMIDAPLHLEGDETGVLRILRADKNRFNDTNEIGVFEMTELGMVGVEDPAAQFLQEHSARMPGQAICPILEGTPPMLMEIQVLVEPVSGFERPALRRVRGIDKNRLDMLIAVLNQRTGLNLRLGGKDIFVNVAGGMKIEEPAVDLAICAAIASAASGRNVKAKTVCFGEVSLLGEIRPASQAKRRVTEAKRLGWPNVIAGPRQGGKEAATIDEALNLILEPEGR